MEAGDNEPRVRPIEITDEDFGDFDAAESSDHDRSQQRPWLPLAVSVGAVAVLLGAVTLFGAVQFEDPPRNDSFTVTTEANAPTTTAPRSLTEAIPGWTGSLTLVTAHKDAELWALHWQSSFVVPEDQGVLTPWGAEFTGASFSSSGTYVAAAGVRPGASGEIDVLISSPNSLGIDIDLPRIQSMAWHATRDDSIAWITNPKSPPPQQLRVSIIDPTDGSLAHGPAIAELPNGAEIVRWDDSGFILNVLDEILVLDAQGAAIQRQPGFASSATPTTITAVLPTGAGPQWFFVDRVTGDIEPLRESGIHAPVELTTVTSDVDDELFVAATYRIDASSSEDSDVSSIKRTTITTISPNFNAPRIIQVDRHVVPIGFAKNTPFLVLSDTRSNDIVFVDWLSGATHIFDVPRDHKVLAVHLALPSED